MLFHYLQVACLALQFALTLGNSYNGLAKDNPALPSQQQPAKNNRVLLLMNEESGLGNVGLATSHALLEHHPSLEIHYASFRRAASAAASISNHIQRERQRSPNTTFSSDSPALHFHLLAGPSYGDALLAQNFSVNGLLHVPGLAGHASMRDTVVACLLPWTGEDYVALYHDAERTIAEVDPAIIVVDTVLTPAVAAAKSTGRKYVMLSANSLKDAVGMQQPWGQGFWKIPR